MPAGNSTVNSTSSRAPREPNTRLIVRVSPMVKVTAGVSGARLLLGLRTDKPVKMTGAVTKFEWTNPHAWIYLDTKDETGTAANWGFELAAASGLMRSGWTRFSVKPGDVVTIEGTRAKNGSNNANAQTVTLASNGRKLFAGANTQVQP